jgi:acetyl esterase/lipase
MPYLDIFRYAIASLASLIYSPNRLAGRHLRTEYVCRLLRRMLDESLNHPAAWFRKRQSILKIRSPEQKKVIFEDEIIDGVPCLWCRPIDITQAERIVVYFHGGGYLYGDVSGYQNILAQLAIQSKAWFVAVNYRLAPEFKFPAAHDDCLSVSNYILSLYPSIPVFLAGDSAGGGLAVATALSLHESNGLPSVFGLLLISPWLEPTNNSASMVSNAAHDVFSRDFLIHCIETYTDGNSAKNPQVDFSSRDLSSLPPLCIQAAGGELLIDQIKDFTNRARQQGIRVSFDLFDSQFHVFQIFTPMTPGAPEAVQQLADFVAKGVKPSDRKSVAG